MKCLEFLQCTAHRAEHLQGAQRPWWGGVSMKGLMHGLQDAQRRGQGWDVKAGGNCLTSNTSPGDTVGAAGAVLGALGSVVGVGNHLVRVRLEADKAIGVLEGVWGCTEHSRKSAHCRAPGM